MPTILSGNVEVVAVTEQQTVSLNNSIMSRARIEIVTGPRARRVVIDNHHGRASYGPFEAGTISIKAVSGNVDYALSGSLTFDSVPSMEVTAQELGVPEDGTDVTAILNAALALGVNIRLTRGITYRVTSSLLFSADGGGLVSDGTARIYASAAAFNNSTLSNKYASNSCVLNMSGQTSSPYTARQNVTLRGIIIESEVSDGRMVDAIVGRNIDGLVIEDCEIFGFPVGCGMRLSSVTGDSRIERNYIHDATTSAVWGTQPQITGIEIDNDIVNSVPSANVSIRFNRIEDLTLSGAALTTWSMQTDGINIASPASYGHDISHNTITNVGEGIDNFGSHCNIANNNISDGYLFGVKLIHGASDNVVAGNAIGDSGIAGIVISSSATGSCARNLVSGNSVVGLTPTAGQIASEDVACIKTYDASAGVNLQPVNNTISGNHCDPGTAGGEYGLYLGSYGSGNVFPDNRIVQAGSVSAVGIRGTETSGSYSYYLDDKLYLGIGTINLPLATQLTMSAAGDLTLNASDAAGAVVVRVAGGERLRVNNVGTASLSANAAALPAAPSGVTPRLHLGGADAGNSAVALIDAFAITPHVTMRRADGTNASKSALASGAAFLSLLGVGYGTSQYSGNAAAITFNASEAFTNTANGSEIRFGVTPIGSTTRATALTVTSAAITAVPPFAASAINVARNAITATSTTTIDCALGNAVALDLAVDITTLAFSNIPASGRDFELRLYITQGGLKTIAWPASVKWPSGAAPTLTVTGGKVDIVTLTTYDGGTTWYGAVIGQNY